MGESFGDLRKRARIVNRKKPAHLFGSAGVVPSRAKSKTVETTGRTAEREMRAMEKQAAVAKPQRKAVGGPVGGLTPVKFQPAPIMPAPLIPHFSGKGAKSGGRQPMKRGR
jgi:hypothetical protein